jgi:prevent-host-death family protein
VVTTTIGQRELRNDNARIMDAVAAGEDFIVTRNGKPVAELRPVRTLRQRFVSRARLAELARTGVAGDAARFRADLDALIDPGL